MPTTPVVTVIGGGMAGCEAAWQLAKRGVRVRLYEMRPVKRTPVHKTDALASRLVMMIPSAFASAASFFFGLIRGTYLSLIHI